MPAATDLKAMFWKYDVSDFDRTKKIRDLAKRAGKHDFAERQNQRLIELQARWPNHKLGDME